MIDWPPNVPLPKPHRIVQTVWRRTRNRAMATAIVAIYAREVISRDRDGRMNIWTDISKDTGLKVKTLERAVSRRQNCPNTRYLAFAILNELIRESR